MFLLLLLLLMMCNGLIAQIMEIGGFKSKVSMQDGETRPEVIVLQGGAILGIPWDIELDMIQMKMRFNLHPERGHLRTQLGLSLADMDKVDCARLTRRMILSQIHGIYDPTG